MGYYSRPDHRGNNGHTPGQARPFRPFCRKALRRIDQNRITSYNVCYTKLLREYGLTYYEASRLPIVQGMMAVAREIILIADSTKFGNVCFHYLGDLSKVNKIITDENLNKNIKKAFLNENIELITV